MSLCLDSRPRPNCPLSRGRNNRRRSPFISVSAMVSQIEWTSTQASSTRQVPSRVALYESMARLHIPHITVPRVASTTPTAKVGQGNHIAGTNTEETSIISPDLDKSLPTTPKRPKAIRTDSTVSDTHLSDSLDSPTIPASWKAPVSWQYISEDTDEETSLRGTEPDDSSVEEDYLPATPFRRLELVIPEASPPHTPISRRSTPISTILLPDRSVNSSPLRDQTPTSPPLIGLGLLKLLPDSLKTSHSRSLSDSPTRTPPMEEISKPKTRTLSLLRASARSPVQSFGIIERYHASSSPVAYPQTSNYSSPHSKSRSFSPVSPTLPRAPAPTPILSPSSGTYRYAPSLHSIESEEDLDHIPNSPDGRRSGLLSSEGTISFNDLIPKGFLIIPSSEP
jgi:hypothetical protein